VSVVDERLPRVILVVEDDVILRFDIVEALQTAGLSVIDANGGEAALDHLHTGVDILFTDIDLSGPISGWMLAQEFRSKNPAIGVIYTSGVERPQNNRVQGSLFFGKPYNHAEIIDGCAALSVERRPDVS